MCKEKDAHCVNGKMSDGRIVELGGASLTGIYSAGSIKMRTQKQLDNGCYSDIIIYTDPYGRPAADQTIVASSAGHAQSPSAGRAEHDLSKQRLFRSAGFTVHPRSIDRQLRR